jgi:hypothetical protein
VRDEVDPEGVEPEILPSVQITFLEQAQKEGSKGKIGRDLGIE